MASNLMYSGCEAGRDSNPPFWRITFVRERSGLTGFCCCHQSEESSRSERRRMKETLELRLETTLRASRRGVRGFAPPPLRAPRHRYRTEEGPRTASPGSGVGKVI